jgi:hypothetical protein
MLGVVIVLGKEVDAEGWYQSLHASSVSYLEEDDEHTGTNWDASCTALKVTKTCEWKADLVFRFSNCLDSINKFVADGFTESPSGTWIIHANSIE